MNPDWFLLKVHLDHGIMGVGGDDSWSPCVHEKFILPLKEYQFAFRFQLADSGEELTNR